MTDDKNKAEVKAVFNRIKGLSDIKKDSELADLLGMTTRNIISYKERGTLPWEYIYNYCKKNTYSLDYIIFGSKTPCDFKSIKTQPAEDDNVSPRVYAALANAGKNIGAEKFRLTVELLLKIRSQTCVSPSDELIKDIILLI